jgi:hypothetical protein
VGHFRNALNRSEEILMEGGMPFLQFCASNPRREAGWSLVWDQRVGGFCSPARNECNDDFASHENACRTLCLLERALVAQFRPRYFEVPLCNTQLTNKRTTEHLGGLFKPRVKFWRSSRVQQSLCNVGRTLPEGCSTQLILLGLPDCSGIPRAQNRSQSRMCPKTRKVAT